MTRAILDVEGLTKHFPLRSSIFAPVRGYVHAVDDVGFKVGEGETFGVVGESGCGKSTLGRLILRLVEPTAGRITLDGTDITRLSRRRMHAHRRTLQVIFQDPYSSLNPRMTAGEIVGEPLRNFSRDGRATRRERVAALLARVGLRAEQIDRYPHEFSGGQRQRLGIARALAVEPRLIVADEPVSALDVSVQAQVVNLMMDLQQEFGLSFLFIAHDLAVVQHISHRIAVMYLGRICELADKSSLFCEPLHPYTEALLAAVPASRPGARKRRLALKGDVPSPIDPPRGCRFHTRCPIAVERCRIDVPALRELRPGHHVACHLR